MSEDLFEERVAAKDLGRDPLGAHLDSFGRSLTDLGYAGSTVRTYLWCLAHFSRWIARRGVAIGDLDEGIVNAFVDGRQRQGLLHGSHRAAVCRLVEHLREQGIVRAPISERTSEPSPATRLVGQYEDYLRLERGLAAITVADYGPCVRRFIEERFGERPPDLGELGPRDVSSFIVRYAHSMSRSRAKLMVAALRSFLRYLFQSGQLEANLAEAVPSVADWRLSTVPRYLVAEEIDRPPGRLRPEQQAPAGVTTPFWSCSRGSDSVRVRSSLWSWTTSTGEWARSSSGERAYFTIVYRYSLR